MLAVASMAKKLSVDLDASILWPMCCARCGVKEGLTSSRVSIGSVRSVAPSPFGVQITSTMAMLDYPVCHAHATGLGFAGIVTRRTLLFRFLRGFIYFTAILGVPVFLMMATRAVGLASTPHNAQPSPTVFIAMFAAGIAAAAYLVHAFRALPVRLVGQSSDTVTIRFSNDAYATRFIAQNRKSLREVPWWKKFLF